VSGHYSASLVIGISTNGVWIDPQHSMLDFGGEVRGGIEASVRVLLAKVARASGSIGIDLTGGLKVANPSHLDRIYIVGGDRAHPTVLTLLPYLIVSVNLHAEWHWRILWFHGGGSWDQTKVLLDIEPQPDTSNGQLVSSGGAGPSQPLQVSTVAPHFDRREAFMETRIVNHMLGHAMA
jgi:hypothetical protein